MRNRPYNTSERTRRLSRRVAENVAMAGLMAASRISIRPGQVRETVEQFDRAAKVVRWISPVREHPDTTARGQALAYRWSRAVPGCSCLHRAVSTSVWLAGFRIVSRVVLGVRKRDALEGHAWLEVDLGDAATLLFLDDDIPYEITL
jgi:hypothetical protein